MVLRYAQKIDMELYQQRKLLSLTMDGGFLYRYIFRCIYFKFI